MNVSMLHSYFVHRLIANFTYPLQVFFILFGNASSLVVGTGHLMFQLAVSVVFILIWGGRGRGFVYINTWLRFIFCIGGLKGRDDDKIPHCECMVAQALRGRTKHDNYLSNP